MHDITLGSSYDTPLKNQPGGAIRQLLPVLCLILLLAPTLADKTTNSTGTIETIQTTTTYLATTPTILITMLAYVLILVPILYAFIKLNEGLNAN